jgi:multidrug efflux pump subunit AcrB
VAKRSRNLTPEQSIYEACLLRYRPIVMTTMVGLLGGLPLALGTGAGFGIAPPAWHCHRSEGSCYRNS